MEHLTIVYVLSALIIIAAFAFAVYIIQWVKEQKTKTRK